MPTPDTVLVTGAAAGIGRALAIRFAAAGYHVAAFDIDQSGLESLRPHVPQERLTVGTLDVRDADSWERAVQQVSERTDGRLNVLINNAGVLRSGRFSELALAAQRQVIEVNTIGTLNGCHTAFPLLQKTAGAQVLNLCSASAIYGQPDLAAYSASKFAVRGLTEALDLEWAEDDISVRALWPLFVDTGMLKGVDIGSTRALGVHLTPEQVADTALKMVQPPRGPRLRGVHHGVGIPARVFMAAASVSPDWANRLTNKMIAAR